MANMFLLWKVFVVTDMCLLWQNMSFVTTKMCLSWQNFCHVKHVFVTTNICCNKSFVTAKLFCCDKTVLAASILLSLWKTCFTIKIILVAASASDMFVDAYSVTLILLDGWSVFVLFLVILLPSFFMEVFLDNLCKAWKSLCFHCVFFLLIVIAAFEQVEIIPGILTISYLVFNILHVSCLFVCFMFCSFSIHRNSKAYWGWGEGRGEGMERDGERGGERVWSGMGRGEGRGYGAGEEEDKVFTWNKAKKKPCSWEKIHSWQLHHTELSKIRCC